MLGDEIDLENAKATRDRDKALKAIDEFVTIDPEFDANSERQRIEKRFQEQIKRNGVNARIKSIIKQKEADIQKIIENAKIAELTEEQIANSLARIKKRHDDQINQINNIYPSVNVAVSESDNSKLDPKSQPEDYSGASMYRNQYWFVTAFLICGIILSSIFAFWYPYSGQIPYSDQWLRDPSTSMKDPLINTLPFVLCIFEIFNAFCFYLLLKWNRFGFSGLVATSICMFLIKIFLRHEFIISLIVGLIPILIIYFILQIKRKGFSTWEMSDYKL